MGEKKNKNKNKNGEDQNKKKDIGRNNIVLRADLYCEGCASKILRCIRSFDGVDSASIGHEWQKITVVGKVDPAKLREEVEQKTHKKVELILNNNKDKDKDKENAKGPKDKDPNNKLSDGKKTKNKSKSVEKKSREKELPLTTTVFKVQLHCEGCIKKIYKIITKTKGCKDVKIDKRKELVTVTGAMDIKALSEVLKKHLKRVVEIVNLPLKNELADKKENVGGDGNKAGNNGATTGDKGKKSSGDDDDKGKKKSGGKGGEDGESAIRGGDKDKDKDKNKNKNKMMMMEGNNVMQFHIAQRYPNSFTYGLDVGGDRFHYNPYAVAPYHAPQIFSDENPNACSVM